MILDFRFSISQALEFVLKAFGIPFVGASLLAIQDVRQREQALCSIDQS